MDHDTPQTTARADGGRMRAIIWTVALLVASVAFSAWLDIRTGPRFPYPEYAFGVEQAGWVGGALSILALSAAVPALIWGAGRLLGRRVGFSFMTWTILAAVAAWCQLVVAGVAPP